LALSPEQADEAQGVFQSQLDKPSMATAAHYGLAILAMQSQRFEQARAKLALAQRAAATAHPWLDVLAFELSTAQVASASTVDLAGFVGALDASNPTPATAVFAVLAAQKAHPALAAIDMFAAQRVTEQWLVQRPQDDAAWGALAALHTQQANAAQASYAQAEQTAAMGVWASSITLLGTAIKLGEATVPIATQNQWRTRLQAIREIAADEKVLLEKFK
jgi:predicted Zn-dependent protease